MSTTVSTAMDRVARECSVGGVSNWFSTQNTILELKDFLGQTVDEILDRVDLADPFTKDTVITGTGVEEYSLPTDFRRLARDEIAVYETTTTRRSGIPVTTNGMWTHLKQIGSAGGSRYYRLQGDEDNGYQIGFYRPLETGSSVTVAYVSKNWLARTGGAEASTWENDTDVLLLPRKVVEEGCVWRFRRRKGLPYADRLAQYEISLSRLVNDNRGIRRIDMGGRTMTGHPMRVPVPDFIPPS